MSRTVAAEPETLRARILAIEAAATDRMKGRDAEARVALLALLTGHHALLLGAPGTGKTMLLRLMASAVEGETCYRACHPWTRERDLIGALDLRQLAEGRIVRDSKGTLLSSHFAILDEAFRASDEARSIILSALNERRDSDGNPIPLRSALLAANDPPSEGLAAAFSDRILFRTIVDAIGDTAPAMAALLKGAKAAVAEVEPVADTTDLDLARAEVAAVRIPPAVAKLGVEIVRTFKEACANKDAVRVSDRRLIWAMGDLDHSGKPIASAVKASAWLAGRTSAHPGDLRVLLHVLWSEAEQVPVLKETIARLLPKECDAVADAIEELRAMLGALVADESGARVDALAAVEKRRDELFTTTLARGAAGTAGLVEEIESAAKGLATEIEKIRAERANAGAV